MSISAARFPTLLFFLPLFFCAQDHGFFRQVWLDQGLSQSSITAIHHDEDGFVWFGTQDGLNRYDGRRIEKYGFRPFGGNSLSGDNVMSIVSAGKRKLWILTVDGIDEIDLSDLKITSRYKSSFNSNSNTGHANGLRLVKMWRVNDKVYAFSRRGIVELNQGNTNTIQTNPLVANPKKRSKPFTVHKLAALPNGQLIKATTEGLFEYLPGTREFVPFEFSDNDGVKHIFTEECLDMHIDKEEIILTQSNKIIICNFQDKSINEWTVPGESSVTVETILKDNHNRIWAGTVGSGIYVLDKTASNKIQIHKHFCRNPSNPYGLNCDFINCLYQSSNSNEDIVWIGTRDAGVFQYSYSANSFNLLSSGMKMPSMNFFSITQDSSGNIWAGTNTGIVKYNRKTGKHIYTDLSAISRRKFRTIEAAYTDSSGKVWIGNANSLYLLDTAKSELIPFEEEIFPGRNEIIYVVTGLPERRLAIGTQFGVVIYDIDKREKIIVDSVTVGGKKMRVPSTASLLADGHNGLWAGTHDGLFYISADHKTNRFFTHRPEDTTSLLSNVVMSVCYGNHGELLVGTSKGMSVLNDRKENHFTNYFSVPGLSNNFIYGIVKGGDGKFWMSTNYGISVFDPLKKQFRTYTAADGTSINEFNSAGYYRTSDGQLIFGGLGGLVGVYPSRLSHSTTAPEIVFVSGKINDKSFPGRDEIVKTNHDLEFDAHELIFDFSILDFAGAAHSRLLYSLSSNGREEWKEMKGLRVFRLLFANFAPGNYTLKVKAVNAEGLESRNPFILQFTVNPPFYNTTWFYLAAFAFVVASGYLIHRIRLRNKIALLQQLEKVRQEENERVRKAAALDLHDEFGNGLTRISMLVETLKIKIPAEQKDVRTVLNVISENTTRLYNGTKDFIWSINPTNDNLYETLIRIKDFGDELFFDSGTDFKAEGLEDDLRMSKHAPGTGRNIVMIFKEALSNTVKHSGASKVNLQVLRESNKIILALSDNGKGFDLAKRNGGFGIGNMKQRAQRIGSEIELYSETGGGTTLKVKIKKEVFQS